MKVYDKIFCVAEHQDLPSWIAVELSGEDLANIEYARKQISANAALLSMTYYLAGSHGFEGNEPFHSPVLHISQDEVELELFHRYAANITIDLADESAYYKWDGEQVVEVDHDDD